MKHKWLILLSFLLMGMAVLLVGCNMPKPTCSAAELVASVLNDPPMWGMVASLTPSLSWSYPDSSCNPEGYRIYLRTGPFFEDDLGGGTGSPATSWGPGSPLQPGTEYAWGIQAMVGTTLGPFAGSRYFFTGPICETASLAAPILLEPADGSEVTEVAPSLIWDYPDDCIPEGYRVDLSITPDFSDTSLSGGTGNPSTRWGPGSDLVSCNTYYWRVAPINGFTLGPFSETFTFSVNVGEVCEWVDTWGSISGIVWHDLCGIPELGPLPDPLPVGCVDTGDGGVGANGIREPGEPGIAGVEVKLGQGACPSTGYMDAITNANGEFHFVIPPPTAGTYCVSANALTSPNVSILIPGGWTYPGSGDASGVVQQEISLGENEDLAGIDFGWDYQFLPSYGEYGSASGMVWHDECIVTPGTTPPPDPLPEGCIVDEWGVVHADGIRQPDELGIEGVVVDIGFGDCPSAGLATAITDENGRYTFVAPTPGNYCLRIDAEGSPNDAILLPGRWTKVPSGHMGMTFRAITLGLGESLADQDFGWDFDNLPLALPMFKLNINANCRYGPGQAYEVITSALAGQSFPIEGRNQGDTWYYVLLMPGLRCWVAASTGTASGDLTRVPFVPAPLLPTSTSTPQVNCSQYTDLKTCNRNLTCEWVYSQTQTGYCKNK